MNVAKEAEMKRNKSFEDKQELEKQVEAEKAKKAKSRRHRSKKEKAPPCLP